MGERLKGKVAVVTGTGGLGIGQGCALALAREGAAVVGCDIDQRLSDETLALARVEGLLYESFVADLTEPAANERLMAYARERFGGLDILVTAAAFVEFAPVEEFDYEKHWKRTLQGELDLVFLACTAAWPHLKARGGGSIINFASANAYIALPSGALAHCATKGGVLAMTRQLAMEGGAHHIRANTISPGPIVTKHIQERIDNEPGFKATIMKNLMLDRLGTPEDIGYCVVYLASDESSWVTGADIRVDAGATAM
jgi:NAD(P)-dependent dehydrogenase (short-subunit alcohol dehydrogenase family)